MRYIDTTGLQGLEDTIKFLESFDIVVEKVDLDACGYSRTIKFTIYDQVFKIVWFNNESNLKIGDSKRAACIPFKYIYLDTTYPLVGGNRSLGFSYSINKNAGMFDRVFDYAVFRIPLEN